MTSADYLLVRRSEWVSSAKSKAAPDTLYRIHGTNEPATIGTNVSSGCIRLTNEDIVDLYNRTPIGAKVIVFGTGKRAGQ